MTPTFGAAILAAGLSTRMGRPKLWLPLGGRPLFYSCVEAAVAAGLSPVILVAGDDPERFRRALDGMPVEVVENPDYRSGMSSSLKVGLSRLSGRVDAGVVMLADQPLVSKSLIAALVQEYCAGHPKGIRIVRPTFDGRPGHPVLIAEALFSEFAAIQGDEGGRSILARHRDIMKTVSWADPRAGMDVDTKQDYERLLELPPPGASGSPGG